MEKLIYLGWARQNEALALHEAWRRACEQDTAFTQLVLYEHTPRTALAAGWEVETSPPDCIVAAWLPCLDRREALQQALQAANPTRLSGLLVTSATLRRGQAPPVPGDTASWIPLRQPPRATHKQWLQALCQQYAPQFDRALRYTHGARNLVVRPVAGTALPAHALMQAHWHSASDLAGAGRFSSTHATPDGAREQLAAAHGSLCSTDTVTAWPARVTYVRGAS